MEVGTSPGTGITDPIITPAGSTGSIGNEVVTIEEEVGIGITTAMARGRAIIGITIMRGAAVIGKGTTTEGTTRYF